MTHLMIATATFVANNNVIISLRLRFFAKNTHNIRVWHSQLCQLFKRGPGRCVVHKIDKTSFPRQVHLRKKNIVVSLYHVYIPIKEKQCRFICIPRQLYQGKICHLYVEEHHLHGRSRSAVPLWCYPELPDFPQVLTFSTLFLNHKQYHVTIKICFYENKIKFNISTDEQTNGKKLIDYLKRVNYKLYFINRF